MFHRQVNEFISGIIIPDLASIILSYLPLKERLVRKWEAFSEKIECQGLIFLPGQQIACLDSIRNRVMIYNHEGKFLKKFKIPIIGSRDFAAPEAMIILPSGEIIIADSANRNLLFFTNEGEMLYYQEIKEVNPSGLAVFPEGFAVADAQENQLLVYTKSCENEDDKWVCCASYNLEGIGAHSFIRGIAFLPPNKVLITDKWNGHLYMFNREEEGRPLHKLAKFNTPTRMAILPGYEIAVIDQKNHYIDILTADGRYLRNIPVGKDFLMDIAVSSEGYIAVANERYIFMFEKDLEMDHEPDIRISEKEYV